MPARCILAVLRIATVAAAILLAGAAVADVLFDLDELAFRTAVAARDGPPGQSRTLAIVHLSIFDAANAIEKRYAPYRPQPAPPAGASADAAALGAGCAALAALYPGQQPGIDKQCDEIAATLPADSASRASRRFGETVGQAQVAARRDDGYNAPNRYRPVTAPGTFIVPALPVGWDVAVMKPFAIGSPSQFRPEPPPALASERWARDYNETRMLGARDSAARTADQTAAALFWAPSGPVIALEMLRNAAAAAGPRISDRARMLALAGIAGNDASIALFDAKYAYNFWRPITAIRNGDRDGNDATERDAGWFSLVEAPPHPEYPCAHCTFVASMGAIMESKLGSGPLTTPMTIKTPGASAATAASRNFPRVADIVNEVSNARVWAGIHFRASTEAGIALGRDVAAYVLRTQLLPSVAP